MMKCSTFALLLGAACLQAVVVSAYWMEDIAHQGRASFNPDATYQVFRNVKDYGAKGDGINDDTAAINAAISSGNRCSFDGTCIGSTTTPATVYFPAGTYRVTSAIFDTYYTQLIGDPMAMPIIKGDARFDTSRGIGIIEANKYHDTNGQPSYKPTNVFFRQVRNLVIDTTALPADSSICGIHWPSSQSTSIQNVVFKLSEAPGNSHVGIFMEEGSGGFLGDLIIYGGLYGAQIGAQQFTTRNLTFVNSQTAILQEWNWIWVYHGVNVVNCGVGLNMTGPSVGSAVILDSFFYNTPVAILSNTTTNHTSNMTSRGSLVLENTGFSNVSSIFEGPDMILVGNAGSTFISGKILGNVYTPTGPEYVFDGPNDWFPSPSALKKGSKYYARSKPQYEHTSSGLIASARAFGAQGDGNSDDTLALNTFFAFIAQHYDEGCVGFVDAGFYRVTDTVHIPPNVRVVGEALASVIMGSGANFSDMNKPRPIVQVGKPGDTGYIEWSDMIVSTQGATAGAVLIEYNLAGCGCGDEPSDPSGIWDVHIRVGGFAGSQLQLSECPTTPHETNLIYARCIAAFMGMHITTYASNLYLENNWFWVADHDVENHNSTQISVYGGRGLLVESQAGSIWAVGSGIEHWTLYQYQLYNTRNVWMGHIQTESPYYQPNPPAPYPFDKVNTSLHDPDFTNDCASLDHGKIAGSDITAPCEMAWALRIIDSSNVVVYGLGLYSFFNNYNTTCSNGPYNGSRKCQSRLVWIEENRGSPENVVLYDVDTVGVISMVTHNRTDVALWKDNWDVFGETLGLFKT